MQITNQKYTSGGEHTSMIPSGSIPSGPPWSFELWERANTPLTGGKFDVRSPVMGSSVAAQKSASPAASARVKPLERRGG